MSTSTTSEPTRPRRDLLLAAILLATYLIIDLGLRLADKRLSGNLAHIGDIPAIVSGLGEPGGSPATLLIGNSLTNNGVDASALPQPVGKVTPDGSSFWDWKCILEKQLVDHPDRTVSRVVLGTAWHLASDQTRADPSRLGALFCSWGDITAPSELGISSPGDIGEFIAARASHLYALRDTLRNRAMARLIPHYQRFSAEQNAAARTEKAGPEQTETVVPYDGLARLAGQLKARGSSLIVVLMPVRQSYDADPALLSLAAKGELRLIDYRHLPAVEPRHFVDEMHLGREGQRVLTAQLAQDLAHESADSTAR